MVVFGVSTYAHTYTQFAIDPFNLLVKHEVNLDNKFNL